MKKWVRFLEFFRPLAQKAGLVWLFLFDLITVHLKKIWFNKEGKELEEKAKNIRDAASNLESAVNAIESRHKDNQ